MMNYILFPITIPVTAGVLMLFVPNKARFVKESIALAATLMTLSLAFLLFKSNIGYFAPWVGYGFEFSLRVYHFSAFIMLAASSFAFLIAIYSAVSLFGKSYAKLFYCYFLITLGFVNGAVMSDNLLIMLFFWEGLLLTMFGMIAIGNKIAFKTATKALIIVGVSDLIMMVGIAIYGHLAGTFTISKVSLPVTGGLAATAFIFLMIGAIAKAGSMPFHSWIPDAAIDAPLPFMAILPAAIEKLVGIYFLTRISLDMFKVDPSSFLSYTLMIIGAITIILAVMMALVQKDYKRLLSYHAISQVGYMILGIGTFVPAGIVGGLFHMINNALYKSCLFLTGGAVEKEAGTTDLEKLGGIGSKMPLTFACFIITALSISGVPPFNGFFSKELVYDGALERGWPFYAAAVIGSFFTAASFLKLGHAAFLGKLNERNRGVREVPLAMLVPMIIISITCIIFGVFNAIPLCKLIQPILWPEGTGGQGFAGMPSNILLVLISIVVLAGALANHLYGVKRTGSGLKAVDHIHYAPILSYLYGRAEKRYFDPYDIGLHIVNGFSRIASWFDKANDWIYNNLLTSVSLTVTGVIRRLHNGNHRTYIIWSTLATIAIIIFLIRGI